MPHVFPGVVQMRCISIWASPFHFVSFCLFSLRDLSETPKCEESFLFRRFETFCVDTRQVSVPHPRGLPFVSHCGLFCLCSSLAPFIHCIQPHQAVSLSWLRNSHQKGKQQSHQNTRIQSLSFPPWEGLGVLLSLTCFSMFTHRLMLYLSPLCASVLAQCSYKRREDTHTYACSFSRGRREEASGYFRCWWEWTTKTFPVVKPERCMLAAEISQVALVLVQPGWLVNSVCKKHELLL